MAERVIILSDGTGNAASSVWRTNVWRVFQSLDLRANVQAARYDDGVGTSSFKPLAFFGGAFGWGLKRNVLDAYKFICRNYQPDAKIYLFGFSRGAFTARVIAGFVLNQGLVQAQSEAELHDLARKAYRAYRAHGYHSISRIEIPFRKLRDGLIRIFDKMTGRPVYDPSKNVSVPTIEFMGLWDTVAAYGLPMDEMTRGVSDWIWPLNLPDRVLSPRVKFARHALALDDERTTFHPVLWTEANEPPHRAEPYAVSDQRLVQVWFAGMHANVGGGYPDDAMAFVPLLWIMSEARAHGLTFKRAPFAEPDAMDVVASAEDKDGRMYDSRAGMGGYYRYGPRKVFDLCNDNDAGVRVSVPKIHHSVFGRIDSGANAYAPIGLPETYAVVTEDGMVRPPIFETPPQAVERHRAQERLWNFVWLRRLAYFATLAATAYIVLFPFFHDRNRSHEYETPVRIVSEWIRLVGSFVPGSFKWWVDWYAGNPEWFLGGVIALIVLLHVGASLQARIMDAMRTIWSTRGGVSPVKATGVQHAIYRFRTSPAYRWFIRFGRLRALPFLFASFGVLVGLMWTSHLLFNLADATGRFCAGSERTVPVNLGTPQDAPLRFETSALCAPTGLAVREGFRYEITITPESAWTDASSAVTPAGFGSASQGLARKWLFRFTSPLRRVFFRPWYMAIARIGETGVDEYFLDPVPVKDANPPAWKGAFRARRSGEVFLYVNDAVLAIPGWVSHYYANNGGTARVTITLANR